jgi:hypothetical protein
MNMTVLIVAVTHMHEGRCCVGALQIQDRQCSLIPTCQWRLLNPDRSFPLLTEISFRVGQVWDVQIEPAPEHRIRPPHTEDSYLHSSRQRGCLREPQAIRLYRGLCRNPQIPMVQGGVTQLFHGMLRQDENSQSFYLTQSECPNYSTSFWIPNHPLLVTENSHGRLRAINHSQNIDLRYTAVEPRIECGETIPAGSLLRVSLARFWRRNEDEEPRSYLMLSQYYGVIE